MDFIEAMRVVKAGEKITRPTAWPEGDFVTIDEGILRLYSYGAPPNQSSTKIFYNWIISEQDIYATDWSLFPVSYARFMDQPGETDGSSKKPS